MSDDPIDIRTLVAQTILRARFYDGEESFYDGLTGFYRDCDPDHWHDAYDEADAVLVALTVSGDLHPDTYVSYRRWGDGSLMKNKRKEDFH